MKKVEELMEQFRNLEGREGIVIRHKLKLINELADHCQNSEDRLLLTEIIENFAEILAIRQTETEVFSAPPARQSFMAANPAEPQQDKQLQAAFSQYLFSEGLSSYTVNDYCSRLRLVWKSYYGEYQAGQLEEELLPDESRILPEHPLCNAWYHLEELHCYVSRRAASDDGKRRAWANNMAALKRFMEYAAENQLKIMYQI